MSRLPPERRALRLSLAAGASYDLVLGIAILVVGEPLLAALGSPAVEPAYYLYLGALPLFILPVLYGAAALSEESLDAFRLPVLWARGGGGAVLMLLTVFHEPPASWLFHVIGAADLLWATVHAYLWRASSD